MATFTIDPRTNNIEPFTVEADDYTDAAKKAARKMFKHPGLIAHRQTGTAKSSGMFQAYTRMDKQGTQNSRGNLFHVMQD